jgi:hypothetical protein
MTDDSPDIFLPGCRSLHEDQALFADIKAADWLGERDGRHTDDLDLKQESSGSRLLDDIRAMDVVNMVRSRCRAEADEPLDHMADPIFLKWVKGVGWVRSLTPVVAPRKAIRVGHLTEQPRHLSDRTYRSAKRLGRPAAARTRWMLPQGPAPPTWKAIRKYRVTLKFLNHDHASVASQLARSVEVCSSQRVFDASPACVDQAPPQKRRHAGATRNAPFHGG